MGYYAYLPEDHYLHPNERFPLLIFLHGRAKRSTAPLSSRASSCTARRSSSARAAIFPRSSSSRPSCRGAGRMAHRPRGRAHQQGDRRLSSGHDPRSGPLLTPPTWQVPCHVGRSSALRAAADLVRHEGLDQRAAQERRPGGRDRAQGHSWARSGGRAPRTASHSTSRFRARGLAVFSSCAWISRCRSCSSSSSSVSSATMSPLTREWNVPASSST